jgi:hypothetical protein
VLSVGQLGTHHREGCGRTQLATAQDRQPAAQPGQAARDATGGAHRLSRLRSHVGGGAAWAGGPARQARLRDAGRVAGGLRRCPAAAGGGGDLPVSGRTARLVLDAADGHQS